VGLSYHALKKGNLMMNFKGRHFPKDLILMAFRWKVAHLLSYRAIEELMEERGAVLSGA